MEGDFVNPADKNAKLFTPSMWPPSKEEAEEYYMERCWRFLPHHQDTGGFFCASTTLSNEKEDYSLISCHNRKCIAENKPEETEFNFPIYILDEGKASFSYRDLMKLEDELKKIAQSADWDILLSGEYRFILRKKDEHLFDKIESKANSMGYSFKHPKKC